MKPIFIEAKTIEDAYFQLLYNCWHHGVKTPIHTGSHAGSERLEFCFAAGFIESPHIKPLAPIFPPTCTPVADDEYIESYFTNYIMDPEKSPNEEYRYSEWINGQTLNEYTNKFESQLEWCIRHFKEKGFGNNHCSIKIADERTNFRYDMPYENEAERKTTPCLQNIDLKIKDNRLILGVLFRSWDLYDGFPSNMGGFCLLNQYIAGELGIEPGPLTFASQGLHCYSHQIESLKQRLNII